MKSNFSLSVQNVFCGYLSNVSQNLLVAERMKGKLNQENLLCVAMLSLLTTDE